MTPYDTFLAKREGIEIEQTSRPFLTRERKSIQTIPKASTKADLDRWKN